MDSSSRRHHNSPATPSHHHHHFEFSPHCPLHSSLLQPNSHHHHHHRHLLPHCPLQISFSPQIIQSHHPHVFPNFGSPAQSPSKSTLALSNLNSQVPETNEIFVSEVLKEELELELEDEVEYAFVLTDEWKEFFTKSEAKLALAKKQAKRKGRG